MRHFALSAIGRDQPGIVAAVAAKLLKHGINIEDSEMTILRGHFTMTLVVSAPDEIEAGSLQVDLEAVRKRLGLDAISLDDLAEPEPARRTVPSHVVTVYGGEPPHDVNDHVAGVADELRRLGHSVTVLAPSNRAADLRAGRRSLLRRENAKVIALGPALPISRLSQMGVPVGVRANLALALAQGHFDVVHGFEPGLPSLSYLALRDAQALAVASFFSEERPT